MRHAYWRKHDGTVFSAQDHRYAPSALLSELGTSATVKDDSVSWSFYEAFDYQRAVAAAIAIVGPDERQLNPTDCERLVSNAINEVIKKKGGGKPVSAKACLDEVNAKAREFFRQATKKRVMITSLSVDSLPFDTLRIEDCEVYPIDRQRFPVPEKLLKQRSFILPHVEDTKYQWVGVNTERRTISEAFDAGTRTLNYLLGVWTFFSSFKKSMREFNSVPQRKWITPIQLGPIYTFHNEDGSSSDDGLYWFKTDYVEDAPIFSPKKGWDKLEEDRRWAFDQIVASPMKNELIDLFDRYADALNNVHLDVAFLMLWALLEKLTDTVGGSYDRTVERAVWNYSDRQIAKPLLNRVRLHRNQFVHAGISCSENDQLCYRTKMFIDGHLLLLLHNSFKVGSLKEYGEFLSLPHDTKRLEKLVAWCQLAHKIQTEVQKPEDEKDDDEERATVETPPLA